jgi:hypothetical protein
VPFTDQLRLAGGRAEPSALWRHDDLD